MGVKKKRMKKIYLLLLFVISSLVTIKAQSNATAQASVNVLSPISITKNADLSFGNILIQDDTQDGTVTLSVLGVRSYSGGVTLQESIAGTVNAAEFIVTGAHSSTFSIQLPTDITISNGAGGSMIVNNFISTPDGTGTISGDTSIKVGATLNVISGQGIGLYTGSFTVTVSYE